VLEGVLVRPAGATKNAVAGLGDGVNASDRRLVATFPYVALPHSGSELRKGTSPLDFRQRFTSNKGVVTAQAFGISPAAKGGRAQLIGVMGNGSLKSLAIVPLNAAGTATRTIEVRQTPGRQLTLLLAIFPPSGSVRRPSAALRPRSRSARPARHDHRGGPAGPPRWRAATPVRRRIRPVRVAAALVCVPLLLAGCSSSRTSRPAGAAAEATSLRAPAASRARPPELGRTMPALGDDGTVPADVQQVLADVQDRLALFAEAAEPELDPVLPTLVETLGGVRIRAVGNTYEPSLGEDLQAAYDDVLAACTDEGPAARGR
jgi:hypothetical protein